MTIDTGWLQARVSEGRDDKDIVAELARQGVYVSPKTIQRRRMEFGMLSSIYFCILSTFLLLFFFLSPTFSFWQFFWCSLIKL
jgi:hypothetical protein